jgi:predicted outer membrane repeat protein
LRLQISENKFAPVRRFAYNHDRLLQYAEGNWGGAARNELTVALFKQRSSRDREPSSGRASSFSGHSPHLFCRTPLAKSLRFETLEDRRLLAVLTVDTDQDVVDFNDGVTSLREAIFAANILPGADEIVFDFGHDGPATILLTQGELKITDSLTITGSGAELLTIDASGSDPTPDVDDGKGSRVFNIDDGVNGVFQEVVIRGLTVTGGDTFSGGGGILCRENLALDRISLSGNSTHGYQAWGGGILSLLGTLTFKESSITNNYAEEMGGAIHCELGRVEIVSSVIRENGLIHGSRGGAIVLTRGDLSISDSTISENRTNSSFGTSIVLVSQGNIALTRTRIDENIAEGSLREDSAAVVGFGIFSAVDCSISNNINLGGVNFRSVAGLHQVSNCTISNNSLLGVALSSIRGGGTHILDSTITDNLDSGMRIRASQGANDVQILRSTISGNVADRTGRFSDHDYAGGALIEMPHGGTALVEDCTIDGNTLRISGFTSTSELRGGAGLKLTIGSTASATIANTTITNNQITSETGSNGYGGGVLVFGGSIYSPAGSTKIIDCLISGNSAEGTGGGVSSFGTLLVTRTSVVGNSADYFGGGIDSGGGNITIIESDVSHNWSASGGGIVCGALNLLHSTVRYNEARGSEQFSFLTGRGGGILGAGNVQISHSIIDGNKALDAGGGIYSRRGLSLINSTVSDNEAGAGGGVWLIDGLISQSTISQNRAVLGGGVYASNTVVNHSTVAFNSASSLGGGIFVAGTPLTLNHSIVARNSSTNPDITGLLGTTITARYSLIRSNSGSGLTPAPVGSPDANGNLIGTASNPIDPLLGPLADNGGPTKTHALLPGSPAINAGEPTLVGGENGVPEFDQRGEPFTRVWGGRIDIGAFEAQSLIVDTLVDENDGDYSEGDFSLREAIDLANRIEGANTIEFAQSLSDGTIFLTVGELKIIDNVQIIGLGADRLTVDAQWMSRVIYIDGNTTSFPRAIDVSIEGLTIANGVAPNDSTQTSQTRSRGAGICFVSSGELNLDDVNVKGNRAFGTNSAGAGVYVTRGIMTITNSQFIENKCVDANNRPSRGAGISSDNDVSVTDSVFRNNVGHVIHVTRNFGSDPADVLLLRTEINNNYGMALLVEGISSGTVQIVQSTINKNSAGGILTWNGLLIVTDSSITNNGGAVGSSSGLSTGGDLTVVRSTVSGNIAESGGGLWGDGHIVVTDSLITNNHSLVSDLRYGGGGILQPSHPNRSQTLTITNSVISNNTSAGHGGGIHASGQVTIVDSVISGNYAAYQGGGIFGGESSNIALMRSTLDGNTAVGFRSTGAGIYSQGDVTVKYSTISNNNQGSTAQTTFGGVVARNVALLNATISGNGRGGIRATTIDARHSTITRNTGTGLYASSVSLDHTIVAGNIFSSQYESDVQAQNLIARYSQISVGAQYLGSLANNGGPTKTHALLSGSPARDAGDPNLQPGRNGAPEFDQRGAPYSRKYGGRVDVGAYEVQLSGGTYYGDFDFDGDVDGRDFLIWQRGFGASSPVGQDDGDATGDGDVDGNDLAVWQMTYIRPGLRSPDVVRIVAEPVEVQSDDVEAATATLFNTAMSDADAAFDDWPVQRSATADFGEMATRRKALRAWRR